MTLLWVLPHLTQRPISAAAQALSGQCELLVVGEYKFPAYLRGDWASVCTELLRDPRRNQVAPTVMSLDCIVVAMARLCGGGIKKARVMRALRVLRYGFRTQGVR